MAGARDRPLHPTFEVLGSLTGVAVVVVGLLYITGILVTSAELWHAGVSVRDTLPLFKLDQLLSRGVSLVLPSIGVLAAFSLVAFGLYIWEKHLREALQPEVKRVADDEFAREVRGGDWSAVMERLGQTHPLHGQIRLFYWSITALGGALILVIPWLLPPVFAGASVAIALGWWVLGARAGAQPAETHVAIAAVILLLATLVNPWAHPRALPSAVIRTTDKSVVTGRLILIEDGRWFLARDESLEVVEPDRVASSKVVYGGGRRPVYELVLNYFNR